MIYGSFNKECGIRKLELKLEHEVAVDVGRTGKLFILSRVRCLLMFLGTSIDTDFPIRLSVGELVSAKTT